MVVRKARSVFKNFLIDRVNKKKSEGKTKIFCVGQNKTGTTSLKKAFSELDFSIGRQREAEILTAKYYFDGKYQPIIDYCDSAQVFQDAPFSCPETYKHLDAAFPNSKFILSVRDDAEQWYRSITRFHAKLFGKNGNIPNADDLKKVQYAWPGFIYNMVKMYGAPDNDIYNKKILIEHYERHNSEVIEYFKNRNSDLLVINLSENDAYLRFVDFLEVKSSALEFPWENRT